MKTNKISSIFTTFNFFQRICLCAAYFARSVGLIVLWLRIVWQSCVVVRSFCVGVRNTLFYGKSWRSHVLFAHFARFLSSLCPKEVGLFHQSERLHQFCSLLLEVFACVVRTMTLALPHRLDLSLVLRLTWTTWYETITGKDFKQFCPLLLEVFCEIYAVACL